MGVRGAPRTTEAAAWAEPYTPPVGWRAALVVGAVAALASFVLPSTAGYDPWSWIIWGREIAHGGLDTVTGPAWKPLPVLFTTPFSLAGGAAPDLWVAVAWAGAAAAVVPTARLGGRLAGRAGAVLAVAFYLLADWWWLWVGLGFSEGVMMLCVLAATERGLAQRHGQAFAFAMAAALVRTEAWPFIGLYGLWLVARDRRRLVWVAPALVALPLAWFIPEQIGSGDFSRAADRVQQAGPDNASLAHRPSFAVLRQARDALPRWAKIGLLLAALTAVTAPARRSAGLVAALAAAWLALICVMAEAGIDVVLRYAMVPLALGHVLAAAGFVWAGRLAALRLPGRWAAALVAAAAALTLVAVVDSARPALSNARDVVRYEEAANDDLARVVDRAGGPARLRACGPPATTFFMVPAVAWRLHRRLEDVTRLGQDPGVLLRTRFPRGAPVLPSERPLDGARARRVLAVSARWRIVAACAP